MPPETTERPSASQPAPGHVPGAGEGASGASAPSGARAAVVHGATSGSPATGRPHAVTPRPARLLGATSFAHFVNDGVVFFVPVVGDLLAQGRHTSTAMVTVMLTIFYVTSAGFGVVVGLFADKVGRRTTMIAVGIAALGLSLLGFYAAFSLRGAGSDALVVAAALVAGVGSSFYHPLGGSILQLAFAKGARGRALGVNGAFGSLGRALYPALFFLIAALGVTKPATAGIFGGLSLLAAGIVLAGLPEQAAEPRPDQPRGARAPAPLEMTASAAVGSALTRRPRSHGRPGSLRPLLSRSVVALTAISFLRSLGFIGVVSWVPIYLTAVRHAGVSTTLGFTVTVMYAGGIVGQPLFGLLADRFDKRLVLALDSVGSAGGIFFFLTTSGDGASALVALGVFGLFTFSGFPLLLSLVADYVPKESSTTGNALVWGIGSTGGQALGPLTVSLLVAGADAHLGFGFAVLGGVVAATALATPLLVKAPRSARVALFG